MFHDESWKRIYFAVQKVKVTAPECVFRQNAIYCHCYCVRLLCWVFPAVMRHAQASPCLLVAGRRVFRGMGFCTLLVLSVNQSISDIWMGTAVGGKLHLPFVVLNINC